MTIQANQGPGVSIFGATSAGGGGSTSPGGSSGQVQYNNGGSFGGMSGTSWDDTNRSLTLTGATVTTSQPVLNLSQTWNAGAVTFTGMVFNAAGSSDANSAAASLLLDLQTGAASVFNVTKTGGFTFTDTATTTGSTSWNLFASNLTAPGGATLLVGKSSSLYARLTYDALATSAVVGAFNSGNTAHVTLLAGGTGGFLYLRPGSSAATQLGAPDAAAPVAQTLQVQSVVAGTSNTAGTNWTLKGSAGTGNAAGGSIIFQVAPAGSSGSAQNAYATALTIGGDRAISMPASLAVIGTIRSNTNIWAGGDNVPLIFGASLDVYLVRDAANTLALRNGTNAQTFNIYNTYTDASNYERLSISWASNICTLSTSGAGTGATNRRLDITSGGQLSLSATQGSSIFIFTAGTARWYFDGANGHLLANADNTYDIGASGANRPRNIYTSQAVVVGTSISAGAANLILWAGRTVMSSPANGNLLIQNQATTDFGLLQFGGTTSSFPALKRSSASLICRLADDSANAAFEALSLKTGAPTGGTSGTWKLGVAATVSPTSPNRTIEVDIGGTIYYIAAKTTND
jgi:hypothetical protein